MAGQDGPRFVTAQDGRQLCYECFGAPGGPALFVFHGSPGSRLDARYAEPAAAERGLQLIGVDRPGFGRSDFQAGRRLLDWPDDVARVADALGLKQFGVMGVSGGGPYVAACALALPERLRAAGIVCGVGPLDAAGATDGMGRQNRTLFALARRAPFLLRPFMAQMGRLARRRPQAMLRRFASGLPEPDRALMQDPAVAGGFAAGMAEAFRQGARGATYEFALYTRPWGFALQDVAFPIHLWQGELDRNVSPAMGRYQAHALPQCRATFFPDDGHLSLPFGRMDAILDALFPAYTD